MTHLIHLAGTARNYRYADASEAPGGDVDRWYRLSACEVEVPVFAASDADARDTFNAREVTCPDCQREMREGFGGEGYGNGQPPAMTYQVFGTVKSNPDNYDGGKHSNIIRDFASLAEAHRFAQHIIETDQAFVAEVLTI